MKFKIYLSLILCFSSGLVRAQDPIFSQYFFIPETMNPAFTGFMETTYAGIIHRTQWPDLDLRVDTDFGFVNTWIEGMNSGVGVSILNQRENVTNYNFTELNVNYAYRVNLSRDWYFRAAVELGVGLKSYAFQNLILEDQININTGVISPTSIDPLLLNDKVFFPDFSMGLLVNNQDAWVGVSVKHLNKPNIAFSTNGNLPLDIFYSINAGYEFLLADYIDVRLFPYETKMMVSANYMQQGEYNRMDIGTSLMFEKIFFGLFAVTNPAKNSSNSHLLTSINAFTGIQWEALKFGISYDFNTSKIGRTGGVYELSLTYQFDLDIKCFGCPNYIGRW